MLQILLFFKDNPINGKIGLKLNKIENPWFWYESLILGNMFLYRVCLIHQYLSNEHKFISFWLLLFFYIVNITFHWIWGWNMKKK